MATQWPYQSQQLHQYQQPQPYQQAQYQQAQQYQQPPYQAPQQFSQSGQYSHAVPQQYQQPTQQYPQTQPYQQPAQQYPQTQAYQQQGQYTQAQPYQQPGQYFQTHQHPHHGQHSQHQAYQQPTQQYPQAQSYQQQGQYSQTQQHPQAGQYSQAQAYQQPPQQYPPAQQQAYGGHQQQYVIEQYPAQQYPPQQHALTHHATSQHAYQQQASPTNAQGITPVTLKSCFNCGTPNHFAQDCPEPKRPVPAGALDPRKFANPLKRVKSGGAVVTKFSPPTQGSHVQGYPQGYPPSTNNQGGQSQLQGSYSPATPTSAHTQAQQQAWQQYYQWQAYQQNQQHQQQHSDASHQPQSQYTPDHQNVTYANSFQQSNQTSTQAPRDVPASQPFHAVHLQTNSAQAQYIPKPVTNVAEMEKLEQQQQGTPVVSVYPQSIPTNPQEDIGEPEDDDLDLLDVPDLPKSLSEHAEASHLPNTIVSPPADLISMPLPANFVVADALYPIPPPGPKDGGRCQSKYLRDKTHENLCGSIQASKYWKDHKDDTVFLPRPDDDSAMPLDEVRANIQQRHLYGEAKDDFSRQSRSQSRGVSIKKDSIDVSTKVEQLEREIAEMKEKVRQKSLANGKQISPTVAMSEASPGDTGIIIKEELSTPPQATMTQNAEKPAKQDTEDILAALGVTGSPKPVMAPNGTYNGLQQQQDSTHNWNSNNLDQRQNSRSSVFPTDTSESGFPPPPPPPPPPFRQSSLPEAKDGSPISAGVNHGDGYAFTTNGVDHGDGYHGTGADGEVLSPDELRYEDPRSRKRSYNRRDTSSDEEDTPARRQEDDVTPKLKRRQPKVAAAYSRRW